MKRPIAVVDLDDTIFDLSSPLCKSLNYRHRKNFQVSDFTEFHGMTDLYEISLEQFNKAIIADYLLEECAPIPGSISSLNLLSESHDIVLCTARGYHPEAAYLTRKRLSHNLISYDHLIIPEKGQTKSEAYNALGLGPAAVLFDDGLHNIEDMLSTGAVQQAWMPKTPWNAGRVPEKFKGSCWQALCFRDCVDIYLHVFDGDICI